MCLQRPGWRLTQPVLFLLIPFYFLLQVNPIWPAPTTQSIIAKIDTELKLKNGLVLGTLTHYRKNMMTNLDVEIYTYHGNRMILLSTNTGNIKLKILYPENHSNFFVYFPLKKEIHEYTSHSWLEFIQGTVFSWLDLSGKSYEQEYIPGSISVKEINGKKYNRIALLPLSDRAYKRMTLLADQEKEMPYRMEFYNHDSILFKELIFLYGPVRMRDKNQWKNINQVNKYIMTDLASGEKSELKITELHPEKNLPPAMFTVEALDKP